MMMHVADDAAAIAATAAAAAADDVDVGVDDVQPAGYSPLVKLRLS